MGGFWSTRSASSNDNNAQVRDDADGVSVKPAPDPAKALATPFPTQWPENSYPTSAPVQQNTDDKSAHLSGTDHETASPRAGHTQLPHIPFIPDPDHNPGLKVYSRFKADPSSILLAYPRSSVDHIQDFYSIYNPSEKGLWGVTSAMVMCGVAAVSKTFMTFGAQTGVYNMNSFLKILNDPHRTRPILTVTNHSSTADDPLLWGALPWKCYMTPTKTIRYALGAQELCYPNKAVGAFFRYGQIVPIIRGNGIYQPAIDKSINLLRSGRWVHIFPEGKINQTDQPIRLKWGVGRVLMEYCGPPVAEGGKPMEDVEIPIMIPIYHLGMDEILRLFPDNSSPIFPKLGLPLTIVFGKPIDFGSLMQEYKEGKVQEIETRIKMTERVFDALEELREVALRLQKERIEQVEQERINKGMWWWIRPIGWGWWRSPDIEFSPKHRDTTVKIEEL